MVVNQVQNQTSGNRKSSITSPNMYYLLVIVAYVVLYFLVMFFMSGEGVVDLINPMNVLSLVVLMLIASFSLKLNYGSILFFVNLVVGVVLVSLLTFTQGLTIVMVMLLAQKLLKVL